MERPSSAPLDFQAVIFCGTGESMHPLTASPHLSSSSSSRSRGDHDDQRLTPKALLPIGAGPLREVLLDRVLAWVEESGIVDVLLLCPGEQVHSINAHLQASWPSADSQQGQGPTTSSSTARGVGGAGGVGGSGLGGSALSAAINGTGTHGIGGPNGGIVIGGMGSNASGGEGVNASPNPKIRNRRQVGDLTRLRISVHGLDEGAEKKSSSFEHPAQNGGSVGDSGNSANGMAFSSSFKSSSMGMRGEESDESDDDDEDQFMIGSGRESVGTARILRRWKDWFKTDFVVLPCDLSPPPALPLSSVLDRHRNQAGSLVTSLWYEKGDLEINDNDGAETLLVGYSKDAGELLMITPLEELEDDLDVRMSLLEQYPTLSLTTKLMDAHVYAFKRQVLDLMMTKDPKDLDSLREDLVPWLIKGGWQANLRSKWREILRPMDDPLAAAFQLSITSTMSTVGPKPSQFGEIEDDIPDYSRFASPADSPPTSPFNRSRRLSSSAQNGLTGLQAPKRIVHEKVEDKLKCSLVIWELPESRGTIKEKSTPAPKPAPGQKKEPEQILIRANTLASYWELNRQYLREMPIEIRARPDPSSPSAVLSNPSDTPPLIDPKAQVSPDSQIDPTTRVGERTSIKRSLIGRHCNIGKNVRLNGCIIWDFVTIADGTKMENSIICNHVRVGAKADLSNCVIGGGFEVPAGKVAKDENVAAGEEL